MRRIWGFFAFFVVLLAGTCSGGTPPFLDVTRSQPSGASTRMLGDGTILKETFPLPQFTYHMVIVDKDVELEGLRTNLVAVTKAHLRAAMLQAQETMKLFQGIRLEDLRLTMDLHRAFIGENPVSGDPEAVVKCSFTGVVVLTNHDAPVGMSPQERAKLQHREISNVVQVSLEDTKGLLGRLSGDKNLPVVEKFTVHVRQEDEQGSHTKTRSMGAVLTLVGIFLVSTILLSVSMVIRRRLTRMKSLHFANDARDTSDRSDTSECSNEDEPSPLPEVL